jgi:hypothetical protein
MTTQIQNHAPAGFAPLERIQRTRDDADLSRAIQAYCFFYPTVSMEGSMNGQREAGAEDNKAALILACGPRHLLFTGSSDTPYLAAVFDLKEVGPMVVDLPPGPYVGLVNDHHFRWVHDLGLSGTDAGKGGRHLILPPGYSGDAPAGYQLARAVTNKVLLGLRALPAGGDVALASNALRKVRIYPHARSGSPPPFTFLDRTEQKIDASCLRWEDNLRFWEKLHKVVQEESTFDEFRPMYGLLTTLNIERGSPFAPDPRMRAILERAATVGRDQMLDAAFASDRPDRMAWKDRYWEWAALRFENGDFELPTGIDIEARNRWFAQAIGSSPAMFRREPGAGSLYWLGLRDTRGSYLDGGRLYRLSVPQPVPSSLFWSVTVYDAVTRSQIQTSQDRAALRSMFELAPARDEPALDLYFGPESPPGKDRQWIQTLPDKGWFAYFRIYGPGAAAFDGSWKPGDFERM